MEAEVPDNLSGDRPTRPEADADVVCALERMRAPIVLAHVVPDADALGALFAIARAYTDDARCVKASLPVGSLSQRQVPPPTPLPEAVDCKIGRLTGARSGLRCQTGASR